MEEREDSNMVPPFVTLTFVQTVLPFTEEKGHCRAGSLVEGGREDSELCFGQTH